MGFDKLAWRSRTSSAIPPKWWKMCFLLRRRSNIPVMVELHGRPRENDAKLVRWKKAWKKGLLIIRASVYKILLRYDIWVHIHGRDFVFEKFRSGQNTLHVKDKSIKSVFTGIRDCHCFGGLIAWNGIVFRIGLNGLLCTFAYSTTSTSFLA